MLILVWIIYDWILFWSPSSLIWTTTNTKCINKNLGKKKSKLINDHYICWSPNFLAYKPLAIYKELLILKSTNENTRVNDKIKQIITFRRICSSVILRHGIYHVLWKDDEEEDEIWGFKPCRSHILCLIRILMCYLLCVVCVYTWYICRKFIYNFSYWRLL